MGWDWKKEMGPPAVLFVLSALLFGFQLGKTGLLDPDEPFYALTAREMLQRGDVTTPVLFGKPQFEKPILFYGVLYASFRWLGVSEFSARLGPCVAGVLTVLLTYGWALALFRRRQTAFLSALVMATSGQFIVMSRLVLTDIFLCLFVTAAFFCFSLGMQNEKKRLFFWNMAFVFCGLGFLTKGPLGLFIPLSGLVATLVLGPDRPLLKQIPWVSGGLLFSAVALPWYALMTQHYGPVFLRHFFLHENVRRFFVAEHRSCDTLLFYPMTLVTGFFPWSVFMAAGLGYAARMACRAKKAFLFLFLSFLVPFVFFVMAKSKLISYCFPLYPVLAVMTGAWLTRFWRAVCLKARPKRVLNVTTAVFWGVAPPLIMAVLTVYSRQTGLDLSLPLALMALTFVSGSWAALFLFWTRRYRVALSAMTLSVVVLTGISFAWLLPASGKAFSSKDWAAAHSEFVKRHPSSLMLASKLFVRGISFYANDPRVGVFSDKSSGGFYTPHPIRVISDAEQLAAIAPDQFPVYFLIRDKELKRLNNLIGSEYRLTLMETSPSRLWVRLERV